MHQLIYSNLSSSVRVISSENPSIIDSGYHISHRTAIVSLLSVCFWELKVLTIDLHTYLYDRISDLFIMSCVN
jgi:hypothetical protein